MTQKAFEPERRRALRLALSSIAAVPFAAALLRSRAQAAEKVDPNGSMAKALQFTEKSTTKGQTCSGCQFYQGTGDSAPCIVFTGKIVPAGGWCKSWVAKTG